MMWVGLGSVSFAVVSADNSYFNSLRKYGTYFDIFFGSFRFEADIVHKMFP